MNQEKYQKWLPALILFALAITWGSSFILIKRGLEYFSAVEVGALRIVIAFLFFIPMAFHHFKFLKKKHFIYLAIVGVIGSTAPAFLFAFAETGIDSALAGILNSLTPLFTFLISFSIFKFKARWFNVVGLLLALSGAMGLIAVSGNGNISFNFYYASFVIIATVCYAINVNVIKYKLPDLNNKTIVVYGFILAGIPTTAYLFWFTPFINTMQTTQGAWTGLGYIAILGVVGTSLALTIFYYLIQVSNTVFASSVTYLIPIVAVLWGVLDGETFRVSYILWITFILYGIYLVNTKKLLLSGKRARSSTKVK
ncbi:MAG TPA: DMT family transporter [Bacteroidales bacterium]|nr:DMT family transporter [Bacteroidales bacterium]